METFIELAGKLESLGVAALLIIAIILVVRYFNGVVDGKHVTIEGLAAQVKELSEARLADQKEWAERYKDGSVRMETALQEVTRAITSNQETLQRIDLKVG